MSTRYLLDGEYLIQEIEKDLLELSGWWERGNT
jgi:hypothetical protein